MKHSNIKKNCAPQFFFYFAQKNTCVYRFSIPVKVQLQRIKGPSWHKDSNQEPSKPPTEQDEVLENISLEECVPPTSNSDKLVCKHCSKDVIGMI
jgi:hypothetical protein